MENELKTNPYKGVRDFYPEDKFIENYIFGVWRKTVESFGYAEYDASVLEPAELYKAKSGEEIVNEQTYTFTDRGGHEVTLRPEMTPSVARMVAAKKRELAFPLRWYSIPNVFRYERPQKGRLREHWQLNVDFFGVGSLDAELEIISVAHAIMKAFGAKEDDFRIRISFAGSINSFLEEYYGLSNDVATHAVKIIDRKPKIEPEEFTERLQTVLPKEQALELTNMIEDGTLGEKLLERGEYKKCAELKEALSKRNIEVDIDPAVIRAFDYYTGIVFEIFDTDPENRRSMFGGGRYDNLLSLFNIEPVPTVGFGMGDVTLRDFLESHDLLPSYKSPAKAYVCTAGENLFEHALGLAEKLRKNSINTAVDLSGKKLGDQLKKAERDSIPFALIIGENEIASGTYKLKELAKREEKELTLEEIIEKLKIKM